MTTKTTTRGVPIAFSLLNSAANNGAGSDVTTYVPFSLTRTRTGYGNPKWKMQIKAKQNAATAGQAFDESISLSKGKAFKYVTLGTTNPTGNPPLMDYTVGILGQVAYPLVRPQVVLMDTSEAEAKALAQCYEAIRNQRSNMNLGVTLGEALESREGIVLVANRLASMFGAHVKQQQRMLIRHIGTFVIGPTGSPVRDRSVVRRLRPVEKKLSQEIRDAWLEFSLGIRPLVKDMKDLAETLSRFNTADFAHTRIKGYGSKTQVLLTDTQPETLNGIDYLRHRRRVATSKVIYRVGLLPDPEIAEFGSAQRLHQLMGFNFQNFVPTVWNLLPYSWAVDTVTNIGSIMAAWATDTSRITYIVKSVVHETVEHCSLTVPSKTTVDAAGRPASQTGDLGGYRYTTKAVYRTIPSALEVPQLRLNLPSPDGLAIPNLLAVFTGGSAPRGARKLFG